MVKHTNSAGNSYWWGLPFVTGLAGIIVALQLFPEQSSGTKTPLKTDVALKTLQPPKVMPSKLVAKAVAMPPAPRIEPVQYQARIMNNRVGLVSNLANAQSVEQAKHNPVSLEQLAKKGEVSPELASRFSQAIADMEADEVKPEQSRRLHPQALTRYPQWYQDLVPTLAFSSHIYSSDKDNRWVKVNQQVVKEGELINADLRLVQITPEQVVIEMQQRQFTLPALSDW